MPSAEYQREWKKRNPEKQKEYSKKWWDKHKEEYGLTRHRKNKTPEQLEKLRVQGRSSRLKHKDSRNEEVRKYRKANRKKELERCKVWYWEHKEEISLRMKENRLNWSEERKEHNKKLNKAWKVTEEGRLSCRISKQIRRSAKGSFTAEDIKDLYATQGGRCYYCSVSIEESYHIDHMQPLSRGGRNDVSNICLACVPCNLSKHTKTAEEFKGEILC